MRSILRASAFWRIAALSAAFAAGSSLLFGFIYVQTAVEETQRIEQSVRAQLSSIAQATPEQMLWALNAGVARDLHRVTFAGLFTPAGAALAGNMATLPQALRLDGLAHRLDGAATDPARPHDEPVIMAGVALPDGRVLVIGRVIHQLIELRAVVSRALELGVIPALLLSLGFGALAAHRTNQRIQGALAALARVRQGQLGERLPVRRDGSDFDQLADGVNHMLAEVQRLMIDLHDVGNNIAHDLRTPLSRVRTQLERARRVAATREDLAGAVDRAVAGLDQAASTVTALLRIAEIEHSRRGASFVRVELDEVAQEALDLYAPIAEASQVRLDFDAAGAAEATADRDLLFEAVANLLDNAVKFTPSGGAVSLRTGREERGGFIEVRDTGPGIPPQHRAKVFQRFFRLDDSRQTPGNGLGLSLVAAILHLHGFQAEILDNVGGGCVVRVICAAPEPPRPAPPLPAPPARRLGRKPRWLALPRMAAP